MTLILASQSRARQAMLRAAGLQFDVMAARLDEPVLIDGLRDEGVDARGCADALAEAKAVLISRKMPDALVIGSDQIGVTDDQVWLAKPESPQEARAQLAAMSGRAHRLFSAAVIAQNGTPIWRHIGMAQLHVRDLSADFINAYVERHWDIIRHCAGCYAVEGEGVQLFDRISGSHFVILGLPLLEVLGFLRTRGEMPV